MEAVSRSNGGSAPREKVNYSEAGRAASEFLNQQLLLSGETLEWKGFCSMFLFLFGGRCGLKLLWYFVLLSVFWFLLFHNYMLS